jgi:hypothetical protein
VNGPPEAPDFSGPPVTELGMVSIGLVAAGVIYLAAHLPAQAPLLVPVLCLVAAVAVLAVNVFLIVRRPGFAMWRFRQVAGWMLLVYLVVSGMLAFTFVHDHTHGEVLGVMLLLLATFTCNVPVLAGYTVARFELRSEP